MNRKQAYKLAIECMGKEMAKYAFDANLASRHGQLASAHERRALEHYQELAKANKYLEGEPEQYKMELKV